ncbi:MAG: amidotransferase [Gammaproteobacteria bacterium HGW-Gammaproteobacteria-14]|nr:MAG: amidotransferase [Gammaproteobacteria bacterium HGW-Gammaproteobacteria-14]
MARIQVLQHVPFEDLGAMAPWFEERGHEVHYTRLYRGESPPNVNAIDWLIIMGGPMGVHDETEYPWLSAEKALIRRSIDEHKTVLGICLGAQLIAHVMGAAVTRNREVEIGWFPVSAATDHPLANVFASRPTVFHWHGDTFAIPTDAIHLCRSEACENQAFLLADKVLGLQFHLETTEQGLADLCADCNQDPGKGQWIQTPTEMASDQNRFQSTQPLMNTILQHLEKTLN